MAADFDIDFVAFQTLTAAEMDTMADNDRALLDWSAYANASFPIALLNDASVTSAKLIEAFFRGRQQIDPSNSIANSQATGLTPQFGWGQINTTAAAHNNETVTFPVAFAAPPVFIIAALNGFAATAQANLSGFTTGITKWEIHPELPTATNFRIRVSTGDGTNLSAGYTAYSWIALGAI